ncbi:unnamed protein product [Nippostrongylus brasiliensis]|uniref:Uncharacterized protein n=1 Tax=Nippostrongylus brasiliensis TaxID=27835 RepID=A0A0N4YX25_NIPBR|nr:unnamed protein product [Nippostrongylus brasiliensis]
MFGQQQQTWSFAWHWVCGIRWKCEDEENVDMKGPTSEWLQQLGCCALGDGGRRDGVQRVRPRRRGALPRRNSVQRSDSQPSQTEMNSMLADDDTGVRRRRDPPDEREPGKPALL